MSIHHAMPLARSAGKEIGAQPPGRTTELRGDEPDSGSCKPRLVNHSCCSQLEIFPAEIPQCWRNTASAQVNNWQSGGRRKQSFKIPLPHSQWAAIRGIHNYTSPCSLIHWSTSLFNAIFAWLPSPDRVCSLTGENR